MSTVTIKPGAATDDAKQIDDIVSQMAGDMATLDKAVKSTIPDGIQTTWSNTVRDNWESYYQADVPQAMEEMKLSANNLRVAVDQTLKYDQEQ